jgi:hypothetical protein
MFPSDADFGSEWPDCDWNREPSRADAFGTFTSAVYTTDADGWLTSYNAAAADLWGYHPELGKTRSGGCRRLLTSAGAPVPVIRERPDGTRVAVMTCPTPLYDASGNPVAVSDVPVEVESMGRAASADADTRRPTAPPAAAMRAGLELDVLTGLLQEALAELADVRFAYEKDCERLEGWTGSAEEKAGLLRQLGRRRQRQCAALDKRVDQLTWQARLFMGQRSTATTRRSARARAARHRID